MPGDKRMSKLDDKFLPGIFLGLTLKSDESLVGTPEGVVRARTIRRLPPAERGDKELLQAIRGTVWKPVPTEEGDFDPRGG